MNHLSGCERLTKGQSEIYYHPSDSRGRSEWVHEYAETFPHYFVVVEGYCNNRKLLLRKKSKINAAYYQ